MATAASFQRIADRLRALGLDVEFVAGWEGRGHGTLTPKSVMAHHTATPATVAGDYPSLKIVRDGRAGLSGPLCNFGLGRSGKVYVVALGFAYHAGVVHKTQWQNRYSVGIEAEHPGGSAPWPDAQRAAYALLVAEIVREFGLPLADVVGHKEAASPTGRKVDPTFDMNALRSDVAAALQGVAPATPAPPAPAPEPSSQEVNVAALPTVREGDRGDAVRRVQALLVAARHDLSQEGGIDGIYGPGLKREIVAFQRARGLGADGIVGPKSWSALLGLR